MTHIRCENCHANVPGYDVIHLGSPDGAYRDLCSRCYNQEIAGLAGRSYNHHSFDPVVLADAGGHRRTFHFLLRHLGAQLSLEAFELSRGERAGYQFQIVDAVDSDLFEIMRRLVERMRRTLAKRYLVDQDGRTSIDGMEVRGRIDCDLEMSPSLPTLVIDGRDVSWNEFGRMMMTFEGWGFQLAFKDPSEE
jgi:hypothetical protein